MAVVAVSCAGDWQRLQGWFAAVPRRVYGCVVVSGEAGGDLTLRLAMFAAGVRMISHSVSSVAAVARTLAEHSASGGPLTCPHCGVGGLTEAALHEHYPLWHAAEPNINTSCPVCHCKCRAEHGGLAVHYHNAHGPPERREPPHPPFSAFTWVIVTRPDGRFLLVNEPAGLCDGAPKYWMPAGRLDGGEGFIDAGLRETLEEGGVEVRAESVLRLYMDHHKGRSTPRVCILARVVGGEAGAKSVPDFESVGAAWVTAEELAKLPPDRFRTDHPQSFVRMLEAGTAVQCPVDAAEFREYDDAVRALTGGADRADGVRRMDDAFRKLQQLYPKLCSVKHRR
eukprot:TRINITY_DN48094_c0_g1_i1.p1 TRINITY_DN48094_c0_g1~~TRINITY_DN48094_c0_g1_i1.p1  ORF type:complete len:398 (+),score=154.32 TRINITY_DN48094_c0_g1_i1:180-1196(+)